MSFWTNLSIIEWVCSSFQGIIEALIITVSHFLSWIWGWSCLDILFKAENSSHWAQVDIIITLSSGICSTDWSSFLIIHLGTLIYHNSWQISTLFTILLPAKNTTLLFCIATFISCIILPTFEAKVASIILHLIFLIVLSKFIQISFSLLGVDLLAVHKLSQIYNFTHSLPILAILLKSAGLSIAGEKSTLKSAVLNISHFGVWIAIAIVSGILWFTWTNSIVNTHNFRISISGSTILYLIFFICSLFWKDFLTIHKVNGVV